MDKIKLLIVDDSVMFREILAKYIHNYGVIEIVSMVEDAKAARSAIISYKPDVMYLDIGIAGQQDGIAFLKSQLSTNYVPTVAASVSPTKEKICHDAGAVQFLVKPESRTNNDIRNFALDLCKAVHKAYFSKSNIEYKPSPNSFTAVTPPQPPVTNTPVNNTAAKSSTAGRSDAAQKAVTTAAKLAADAQKKIHEQKQVISSMPYFNNLPEAPKNSYIQAANNHPKHKREDTIIALGASTGGTEALEQVIRNFPENTPPVVIVQHMPAGFTKLYAERLNRSCKMRVKEAQDGDRLTQGMIVIGAGGFHLRLHKDANGWYISSKEGEKVSGHCPSVDVLFNSVAATAGSHAIGALLTGMGRDGADGLLRMREAGAFTIGQDRETCVVYGMPMEAYKMGAVEAQVPLDKIAEVILGNIV